MKKKLFISIIVILTVLVLTGVIVYSNYKSNLVSQNLIDKYNEHEQKIFPYILNDKPYDINKEIETFKNSIDINTLSGNDKDYIECILKVDSLRDKLSLNPILGKINDKMDRAGTNARISLLQIEGSKLIDKRNANQIREYNKNFDTQYAEIINEYMPEPPKLEIQSGWTWDVDGNYSYVKGRVKNVSNENISYFEVTAEYLDSAGQVLDSDYTNSGETLRSGNMKEFEIMHKHDSQYDKVRIFINDVRVE